MIMFAWLEAAAMASGPHSMYFWVLWFYFVGFRVVLPYAELYEEVMLPGRCHSVRLPGDLWLRA